VGEGSMKQGPYEAMNVFVGIGELKEGVREDIFYPSSLRRGE